MSKLWKASELRECLEYNGKIKSMSTDFDNLEIPIFCKLDKSSVTGFTYSGTVLILKSYLGFTFYCEGVYVGNLLEEEI